MIQTLKVLTIAILVIHIIDCIETYILIRFAGAYEINPIMRRLMNKFGLFGGLFIPTIIIAIMIIWFVNFLDVFVIINELVILVLLCLIPFYWITLFIRSFVVVRNAFIFVLYCYNSMKTRRAEMALQKSLDKEGLLFFIE